MKTKRVLSSQPSRLVVLDTHVSQSGKGKLAVFRRGNAAFFLTQFYRNLFVSRQEQSACLTSDSTSRFQEEHKVGAARLLTGARLQSLLAIESPASCQHVFLTPLSVCGLPPPFSTFSSPPPPPPTLWVGEYLIERFRRRFCARRLPLLVAPKQCRGRKHPFTGW